LVNEGFDLQRDNPAKLAVHINYIDFGEPDKNIFVDSYTMKESSDDGITVRIAYEPRLARVILSDEQAREIQKYYDKCTEEGSNPEQVEESKR